MRIIRPRPPTDSTALQRKADFWIGWTFVFLILAAVCQFAAFICRLCGW
jgi:hypothetical protein